MLGSLVLVKLLLTGSPCSPGSESAAELLLPSAAAAASSLP